MYPQDTNLNTQKLQPIHNPETRVGTKWTTNAIVESNRKAGTKKKEVLSFLLVVADAAMLLLLTGNTPSEKQCRVVQCPPPQNRDFTITESKQILMESQEDKEAKYDGQISQMLFKPQV